MFPNRPRIWLVLLLPILLPLPIVAQDSSDAEVYFSRGESYLQAKQYGEAVKQFQQAIRIKTKWPEAYFKLGLAYSAMPIVEGGRGDNLRAALKAFEEAVRLKPDWPEALIELGRKYSTVLQYDKAITVLKKAIGLKPEVAEAHQYLAIVYLYLGHYSEAIDSLQEAISLMPGQPLPHKLLGLAYLVLDDKDRALEQYKILESLDSEMASYLDNAIHSSEKPTFGVASGKLISVPKPDYPAAARSKRVVGNVTVEVVIDSSGKVTSARALNGPEELRGAAEVAALKARFSPTKLSGIAVTVKGVITFSFVPQ